jgi:heme exporter protein A
MVTGSNGAGKSTLLRAVAGLIPKAAGAVALRLEAATPEPVDVAEHTHYLGHANGLKLALTAAENLRFAAAWSGTVDLTPGESLAAVGLAHVAELPVGFLSAGQRRRVALARLLVARRPLWLLDEPAAALDSVSEALLAELIRAHLEGGGLALAAVHGSIDVPARTLRLGA